MKTSKFIFSICFILLYNIVFVSGLNAQKQNEIKNDKCEIVLNFQNELKENSNTIVRDASISKGFHFSISNNSSNKIELKIEIDNIEPSNFLYKNHNYKNVVQLKNNIVIYGLNDDLIIENNQEKSFLIINFLPQSKLDFIISQYVSKDIMVDAVNFSKLKISSINCKDLNLETILQSEF